MNEPAPVASRVVPTLLAAVAVGVLAIGLLCLAIALSFVLGWVAFAIVGAVGVCVVALAVRTFPRA